MYRLRGMHCNEILLPLAANLSCFLFPGLSHLGHPEQAPVDVEQEVLCKRYE